MKAKFGSVVAIISVLRDFRLRLEVLVPDLFSYFACIYGKGVRKIISLYVK